VLRSVKCIAMLRSNRRLHSDLSFIRLKRARLTDKDRESGKLLLKIAQGDTF